mgnify:CR=1 FL=1
MQESFATYDMEIVNNTPNPFTSGRFQNITPSVFNRDYLQLLIDVAQFCHPIERKKSVRMFLRSLYSSSHSFEWFSYIANHAVLSKLVSLEPNLPEKLHRQILRTDYPIAKRLSILLGHYDHIEQFIRSDLLGKALLDDGLELAMIELPEHKYWLKLVYGKYPAKEGELSIVMFDTEGNELVRLSFSLLPLEDGHALYIGGLQGATGENAREHVGEASKACYGLAPRRIAMEVLFAIAKHTGAVKILGVPDKRHISSKKLSKHFNYDAYWLEFESSIDANGDYVLPLIPKHKDYADTPRKRRAKYRRQHELLDMVSQACLASLQ